MYSKEDILREAQEHQIRFILLQFTDIMGVMKNINIPTSQLEKALNNEMGFDGSSIDGFVRVEESDMYLHPDLSTWCVFPWEKGYDCSARLICDIYTPEVQPFSGDPRYVLRRAMDDAAQMGYKVNIGPEMEFFLFHTDKDGAPTLETHDKASYFDLAPVDLGDAARREMVLDLEDIGFEVEASHHECAPGQHEIDFRYADAMIAADRVQTLKFLVRQVAQRHGLHATFMPKPIYGVAGSGMHVNLSLNRDGENAFCDPEGPYGLSQEARWYLGGLLKYCREFSAITNPTINSYKRLLAGYEAPVYVAWALKNRSPLVRVPAARGKSTRLELRSPDPSCNPYLAFAVMIQAGLRGILDRVEPPEPLEVNIFDMDEEARQNSHLEILPQDLHAAVACLSGSDLMREALGEHVFRRFQDAKAQEWADYTSRITDWELEHYLSKF